MTDILLRSTADSIVTLTLNRPVSAFIAKRAPQFGRG